MSALIQRDVLAETAAVWAPETGIRRVGKRQTAVSSTDRLVDVLESIPATEPGYFSVYGFPNGHPRDGGIPVVDTLFIDLDIPSTGNYGRPDPESDEADLEAWTTDMHLLLARVRRLAAVLIDGGYDQFIRAALSGYKGIHLYVDFEPLRTDLGSIENYKMGLAQYAADFIRELSAEAGIDVERYFDVDSSDLARLTRMPNTVHEKATAAFGEPRYCVPVSLSELTEITPERYVELTRSPRRPLKPRYPSVQAGQTLTMYVAMAVGDQVGDGPRRKTVVNLNEWDRNANEIGIDDVDFLLSNKPCLRAFVRRADCYDYGDESHQAKLALLIELAVRKTPVGTVLAYFDQTPNHDQLLTKLEYQNVLRYQYSPYRHDTLWRKAGSFCNPENCRLCAESLASLS